MNGTQATYQLQTKVSEGQIAHVVAPAQHALTPQYHEAVLELCGDCMSHGSCGVVLHILGITSHVS